MTRKSREPMRAMKAYQVFIEQLQDELGQVTQVLEDDDASEQLCEQEMHTSFHKIKGGAGFFGLDDVADIAAELEDILEQPLQAVSSHIDDVRQLVDKLGCCLQTIQDEGDEE